VIVSAAASAGPARQLLLEAQRGSFQAVVTPYIIAQVRKVLAGRLRLSPDKVEAFVQSLPVRVAPDAQSEDEAMKTAISLIGDRDPTDAPILAAALDTGVDAIVTGDRDFFDPRVQAEILVISPSEALELCRSTKD